MDHQARRAKLAARAKLIGTVAMSATGCAGCPASQLVDGALLMARRTVLAEVE